jgi:hypothetical protein
LKAVQTRPTVDFDKPERFAIDALDQCVALSGVSSRVATTISSTWSSVIVGTRPGRGSSVSPSRRFSIKRLRHLPTVSSWHPSFAAACLLSLPSAQDSIISARSAKICDDLVRRAHLCKVERSSSESVNWTLGRPVLAMRQL